MKITDTYKLAYTPKGGSEQVIFGKIPALVVVLIDVSIRTLAPAALAWIAARKLYKK